MSSNKRTNHHSSYNSSTDCYTKSISRFEVLSLETEKRVSEDIRNGIETTRNELIEGCLRFVINVASRYSHLNIPFQDLINDGNYGLIKAAKKFDPDKEARFITFAFYHITGEILGSIHLNASLVRIPKYLTQKRKRIEKALCSKRIGKIDNGLIAELNQILQWNATFPKYNNIDDVASIQSLEDSVESNLIKPENKEEELKRLITSALSVLPENERNVILLYFGLNCECKNATFQKISDEMGLSKEGVRIIKIRALAKLRELLKNIDLDDYMEL